MFILISKLAYIQIRITAIHEIAPVRVSLLMISTVPAVAPKH